MKLNQDKITRTRTMFSEAGEISFPQCPRFREEAENIVKLLGVIPPFPYSSAGEFQKRIIIEYWLYFDGLERVLTTHNDLIREKVVFREWFLKATPPENIRRASQWLCEPEPKGSGIITLEPTIRERALERAEGMRAAVGNLREGE